MQPVNPGYRLRVVIRFIVRTAIVLAGNAVGLIVASLVFDSFEIDAAGFILSLVIFTVATALLTPFLESTLRRNQSTSAAVGGVALISTFVALLITDLVSDGLSIRGIGTWIGATIVVWLGALIAVFILPYLGLKKYLEENRAA
jgi:O-antigen/teichoic acid export membrane protein